MIFNELHIKTHQDTSFSSLKGSRKLVRYTINDIRQLHAEIDLRDNTSRPTHIKVQQLNAAMRELKRRWLDYRRAFDDYRCWMQRVQLFNDFKKSYLQACKVRRQYD